MNLVYKKDTHNDSLDFCGVSDVLRHEGLEVLEARFMPFIGTILMSYSSGIGNTYLETHLH